jgi:hypothetical protein
MGMRLYERRYSKHKNHFDISLKQTCSDEIQVIPMSMFENLCFVVLVKL